jgi:hypothetical protein
MTGDPFGLLTPRFGQYSLPRSAAAKRFIVPKHRVYYRQNLSPYSHFGRRHASAPKNSTIQTLKPGIRIGGMDTDFHTDPP